jgi:hypothetical protein
MKPDGMIRCYRDMAALLYWVVYNFDLGPFGPMVLLVVQSWLKRARNSDSRSGARRRVAGFLAILISSQTSGPAKGCEGLDRSSAAPEDAARLHRGKQTPQKRANGARPHPRYCP